LVDSDTKALVLFDEAHHRSDVQRHLEDGRVLEICRFPYLNAPDYS